MKTAELHSRQGICRIISGDTIENAGKYIPENKTIILADEKVIRFHGNKFPDCPVISIPSGEASKSITRVVEIYKQLLEAEVDRTWFILGIGGGITTDLAGFVASTYLRGLAFGFISTTLLGQVDAALGGKNGVNLDGFKNIVGVIRQPEFVICDIQSLKTLEKSEFINGWAEVIKYAAIRKPDFYTYLDKNLEEGLKLNVDVLDEVVYQSVKAKLEIVEKDEFETGERKLLNFGHTFAHGLEKLYKIPHGEAVAIGMVMASKVSVNFGLTKQEEADKLINMLSRAGLPVSMQFDPEMLTETMRKDKKRAGSDIQLVLLVKMGEAVVKKVPVADFKSIVYDLR